MRLCAYTGHEWLLRELLGNLLDNAIKYTPPGGRVTLRCGVTRLSAHGMEQAFLEREDDGPGVPMDVRALVLERFYRVPGTMVDGNGLGLPIAEEIARCAPQPFALRIGGGRGLRVSLYLPT